MASNDGFTRRIPKNASWDVAEHAGAKKSNGNQCAFPVAFFLQLEAQSVKKIGKKAKKCKINAKVQTEMQPELQQSNDADTSCKKKQRWDRQSSRCKKNAIGTGDCKKKTKQPPNCKKNAMWQTKCKKKRCDRQSVKKSDGTGKVQKKCNVTNTVQKKAMWPAKCKKKAMGRAKCKKKAMERAKCKKNATGQFVVSRIWQRQPTGWNHKTTTSSTCFFFVCVFVCGSAYSSASEAMIRTARRVQYPVFLHANTKHHRCMTDIFFSSLWEKEERGTH